LYRWRTNQWLLTEHRAEQLRAVALDLAQQMQTLAYQLKMEASAGRSRGYQAQSQRTHRLTTMQRWPGRGNGTA
jgi:hypothetical protein